MLGKPKSINYEWCNIGEILLYVVQLMESYAAQYRGKLHLNLLRSIKGVLRFKVA
ncbi:sporulation kinase [Bacillus anthracis]|nr:sporulation kinase [Bacillus cereus]AXY07487.1 sporulation kinase [Bacillus thuringiensis LM1212]OTY60081.1 sporulation kinase [Bacillus thuringiensis serovar graciosensis]PFC85409.1 sporulation kinase [Bacillus anthracis]PFT23458.1 sporulation kinase [Bacillus thuringiensis]QDF25867.1 sporulation kinase [Bacillus tropicus]